MQSLQAEAHANDTFAVDATKSSEQRKLLEAELEAVGIRLNTKKPDGEILICYLGMQGSDPAM
jgi:ribosome-interacting GTPase 1